MMKRYFIAFAVVALVAIPSYLLLQDNASETTSETAEMREKYLEHLENSPFKNTLNKSKQERLSMGIPPNKYNERVWELTMDPNLGRPTPEVAHKLLNDLETQRRNSLGVPGSKDRKWTERGPDNIGGRVRAIIFDPNDSSNKKVIAAGVSGGIWINEDITSSTSKWKSVEGVPGNLSVTCITVDPNNSKIMYVGTGEVYTWGMINGNGVYKSIDGGNTWKHVYGGNESKLEDKIAFIQDIVAWKNPSTGKTEIFFGVDAMVYIDGKSYPVVLGINAIGLYRSTDDGKSFNKIDLKEDVPVPGNNFAVDSEGGLWMGSKAYHFTKEGGGKIFSTKDGANWTKAATEFENASRVQLAFSQQTPGKAYALIQSYETSKPVIIVATTDGFKTSSNKSLPNDADGGIPANDFTRGQNFYDLEIAVDPNSDNTLYVGGIDLFKSTDGASRWKQISHWTGSTGHQFVHADQHAIVFGNGSSSVMAFGNDGGVFYSNNSGSKISSRNKGLNITQFYKGNISMSGTEKLIAGAQDNGVIFINNAPSGVGSGKDIAGGDGGYCFIDRDGKYLVSSYVYNSFKYHSATGGFRYQISSNSTDGDFITQATLDSKNDILYTNGSKAASKTYQIYKYKLGSSRAQKSTLKNDKLTHVPLALRVSPFDASKLYVGTLDGKVLVVNGADGGSQTWEELTKPESSGTVSSIEFGKTANDIFVTYHNWAVKSIFYSNDGGKTWQDKEGNLPNIPVKCILQNPLLRNEVIVGTELGVWATSNFNDARPSWRQSFNGMKDVKVMNFDFRPSDNTILATTFGRGLFTGKFTSEPMSTPEDKIVTGGLSIYPTVSNGEFNIASKTFEGDVQVNIFTLTGKRVYNKALNFRASQSEKINLNGNASGMYLVNITDGNSKLTKRIIIK